jgi:molybdopterin-guanine dinucleotide biosynthesis protein
MTMIIVGGHTRNIGKTSVVEGIIRAMPELGWTAIKITQFGHDVCSVDGELCDCATAEHQFTITSERRADSGTDTSRFLAAGARRSLWVRTRQGELFTAMDSIRSEIERDHFVIVESNSLRRFLEPDLFIQVVDPSNSDFKLSAQQYFDLADAYLVVAGAYQAADSGDHMVGLHLLAREEQKGKPCFEVSAEEGFVSSSVLNYVRGFISAGERLSRGAEVRKS